MHSLEKWPRAKWSPRWTSFSPRLRLILQPEIPPSKLLQIPQISAKIRLGTFQTPLQPFQPVFFTSQWTGAPPLSPPFSHFHKFPFWKKFPELFKQFWHVNPSKLRSITCFKNTPYWPTRSNNIVFCHGAHFFATFHYSVTVTLHPVIRFTSRFYSS